MINTDGNTYAINQHLNSLEEYGYAQHVMDQMSDKELVEYAEDWEIYIKDEKGKWLNDGLEELYQRIDENINDFMWVFV